MSEPPPGSAGAARSTYQSGIRWGQPRGPSVAQMTVRSCASNEVTSASVILIRWRRLTAGQAWRREGARCASLRRRVGRARVAAGLPSGDLGGALAPGRGAARFARRTAGAARPRRTVGLLHARHRGADGVARVLRREHGGVARFLEDLAHEPVEAREAELDHDGAVAALVHHAPHLARPPRSLGGDPHAGAARGLDLARAQPAVDLP